MEMIQIATAVGEVNAEIIKGVLENVGISAGCSSANTSSSRYTAPTPNHPFGIFVPKDKAEEALAFLKDRGLIVL